MQVCFKDASFGFEFVRNLGFTYYGGADLGEMVATAGNIVEGDMESWYRGWHARAERIAARADKGLAAGHVVSAREGYLRASTYFRMAEFYLHGKPSDPRILEESRAMRRCYTEGAKLSGATWEPVEIAFEGTTLPGYFYKVDGSDEPRKTLVFHGGLDSCVEELGFFCGLAAVRHGYNCLTFDGPGQGAPIREDKLYHRYDWEKIVTPALDYALSRPDVDGGRVALMGMSLGGYFAARAAAFEHRFGAVVLFNGLYDYHASMRGVMPKESIEALDAGDPLRCEKIIYDAMAGDTDLRWNVEQAVWSFGANGIADYLENKVKPLTMEGIAGQIRSPTLVLAADGDILVGGQQPQQIYDALTCPKDLFTFTAQDGAENHCESGALAYLHEVVFNWLDETLAKDAAPAPAA